jgi:proline racemase
MAQLWARDELAIGQDFVNESYIGTRFVGRLVAETSVAGTPAVVPTVTGRAWITGTAQYLLDPEDPFPAGFLL